MEKKAPKSVDNRKYESFKEYKQNEGMASKGNQLHHIVEQNQIKNSGFDPTEIYSTKNTIEIDTATHRKISAYYSTSTMQFTDGLTVRKWLANQSFDYQYQFGLDILNKFCVGRK